MKTWRALLSIFILCAVPLAQQIPGKQGDELRPVRSTNAAEIVARLAENNNRRHSELRSYTSQRQYHLLYTGFTGRHEADLVVEVKYQSPDKKDFTILSENGSRLILNRVFRKILETEKEASSERSQASTALSAENYEFELLGEQELDGRPSYVLRVNPKTENRLLYRGRVWIDAEDFALSKIEGEPAKRPSVWVSKIEVHHTYRKVGDFWLPSQNQSDTEVRLGGHATLSIRYGDYKVIPAAASTARHSATEIAGKPDQPGDE